MAVLALTNVYLDAEQKKALTKRAKLKGTNLSVEVRNAVDSMVAADLQRRELTIRVEPDGDEMKCGGKRKSGGSVYGLKAARRLDKRSRGGNVSPFSSGH